MSDSVYYHQGCPICGRTLMIGVRLLGHRVYCQHCGGGFRATDPTAEADTVSEPAGYQAERVEQLLARAAQTLAAEHPELSGGPVEHYAGLEG